MIRGWCYNFYEPEVKTLTKRWLYVNGLEHFDLVNVAYLSLHSPILWNGSYDYAVDNSINELRPRHTMRQITATSRLVCTAAATSRLCLVYHCDMSHKFKPVWICATDHSDKILSQRQWFSHVTRGDLLQQPVAATCRSDLSHRVSRPLHL